MASSFNTHFSTHQSFVLLAEELLFYFKHTLPGLCRARGRQPGLPPYRSAALCSCFCWLNVVSVLNLSPWAPASRLSEIRSPGTLAWALVSILGSKEAMCFF